MEDERRYVVAQYRPQRVGMIPLNYYWEPILSTDSAEMADRCRRNWASFTGYNTVSFEWRTE